MKKLLLLFSLLAATTLGASAQNEIVDYFEIIEAYATLSDLASETTNLVDTIFPINTYMLWITPKEGEHEFFVFSPDEEFPNDPSKDRFYSICQVNTQNISVDKLDIKFEDNYPKFAAEGKIISTVIHSQIKPSFILLEKLPPSLTLDDEHVVCLSIYFEPDFVARKWRQLQFYGRTKEYNHTIP